MDSRYKDTTDIFSLSSLIARFMGPTWGPSGADRTQVGPMLAPWTLLSGMEIPILVRYLYTEITTQEELWLQTKSQATILLYLGCFNTKTVFCVQEFPF